MTNLAAMIDPTRPDAAEAFVFLDETQQPLTLSYGDLRRQIVLAANWLHANGYRAGDMVAILAGNDPAFVPAMLGAHKIGCVVCPISWKLPAETIQFILADSGAKLLVTDAARRDTAAFAGQRALLADLIAGQAGGAPSFDPGPDDFAFLMYTSGSTGQPKGVPITHAGYSWALTCYEYDRARATGTRSLVAAPLYHMNAQCTALTCLYLGASIVQMSAYSPAAFLDAVAAYKVAEITGVPTMLAQCVHALAAGHQANLSSVGLISLGSAPLSLSLLDQIAQAFPAARIANGYGTTETGFVAFGADPHGRPTPKGALGWPAAGVEVKLDPAQPVEGGARGVLWMRTKMMARAYHNRPDQTALKFKAGWYNTGDVLFCDDNGCFSFVERADDMFIVSGNNVYPEEVERALCRHPEVHEAAIVGAADAIKGQVGVGFVVMRPGARFDEAALLAFVQAHLPRYAVPRRLIELTALPLSGVNKIDRMQLKIYAASGATN